MVKAYLRYEAAATFGVVASTAANVAFDASGKLLVSAALENLLVWNLKQGAAIQTLAAPGTSHDSGPHPEVTAIAFAPTEVSRISVGYSDGSIRIWDFVKGTCEVVLSGHKSAVTALRYSKSGALLASGAKDTDVIVWDVVGEAGLYRLKGHRDQVTDLVFLEGRRKLVSCSKDTFVRVWDLDTQHCTQTVVGHRGEVWSLDVDPSEQRLATGSADVEIRWYAIADEAETSGREPSAAGGASWDLLTPLGSIRRQSTERVATLRFNPSGTLLGCQGPGKALELYRVRDAAEAARCAKRRKKRKQEKMKDKAAKGPPGEGEEAAEDAQDDASVAAADELSLMQVVRSKHKIRSFAFSPGALKKGVEAQLALSLHNNSIEVYDVTADSYERTYGLELPGHRSDVRAVALSSDDSLLLSTSHNAVKVWNPRTGTCLRTMDSGYGLSALFVPGNRQAVVGTKGGALELFDVGGSSLIESVEAHTGAVWSIAADPKGTGFASASADHDVKFWEYEVVREGGDAAQRLAVRNTRTLKMTDDVLCVRFSPDGKYIAVALLDSTIKVFFADTLKFFLSLYGHKLPVLSLDISSDGALLASGSADKNLKIWGMDFGDCHRSLFAHQDSVMQVAFVRNTHYLFTVGKDKSVKYWDVDKFELLLTLDGHHAEVWCLAVSSHGDFLVTGSHDRSLRRWERTEEPFFVEEEREKRLESMFEAGIENAADDRGGQPGDDNAEGAVGAAGRRTQETISAADSIIEALEMAELETQRVLDHRMERQRDMKAKPLPPNPLMLGLSPAAFVLKAVAAVRTSDLEQALLVLPFSSALHLLDYIAQWLRAGDQIELSCRAAILLLRLHQSQLVATTSARPTLLTVQNELRPRVQGLKSALGFNLAALGHVQRMLAAKSQAPFGDAVQKVLGIRQKLAKGRAGAIEEKQQQKKKKRKKSTAENEQ